MKKFNWLLVMLLLALVPVLQSCDDDGYSIGDIGWDWATVRATGGGGYYLEGDRWGMIDPVASSIPAHRIHSHIDHPLYPPIIVPHIPYGALTQDPHPAAQRPYMDPCAFRAYAVYSSAYPLRRTDPGSRKNLIILY